MLITKCITKHLSYGELQSGVPTPYYLPSASPHLFWPVGGLFIAPKLRTSRYQIIGLKNMSSRHKLWGYGTFTTSHVVHTFKSDRCRAPTALFLAPKLSSGLYLRTNAHLGPEVSENYTERYFGSGLSPEPTSGPSNWTESRAPD